MSNADKMRVTPETVAGMKQRGEPIAMVTAYDATAAGLADQAGIDVILVGDTQAEMVQGQPSTVSATMTEQVVLTRAVAGAVERALVVGDLPFGSYEASNELAVANAILLVKEGGAHVVKLEGARIDRIRAIAAAGIGVMAHLGLTPQTETALGGRKAQGRTAARALRLVDDAQAVEEVGCFALVLEAVAAPVAARITQLLSIPTIGIGAGAGCDGQVLVYHDVLGLFDWAPRFAKRYVDLKPQIAAALARSVADVRAEAKT